MELAAAEHLQHHKSKLSFVFAAGPISAIQSYGF